MKHSLLLIILWFAAQLPLTGQRLIVCDQWRGFGIMGLDSVAPARLNGDALLPLDGCTDFSFSVLMRGRLADWRFVALDSAGRRLEVGLYASEKTDAFGGSERKSGVVATLGGKPMPTEVSGKDFPSPDVKVAALTLSRGAGGWEMRTGSHHDASCLRFYAAGFIPVSVGVAAAPGSGVSIGRAELNAAQNPFVALRRDFSADSIAIRLERSADPMEGYWSELDRSLEENMLRPGGDYKLVALADGRGGYEMLYLEGARAGAGAWKPGMLKVKLLATSLPGVYDCMWYDASGRPLSRDVKAQLGADGRTLTISFPYQNSSVRLIREPRRAPRTT